MTGVDIDRLIGDAVKRAGRSADIVPRLRNMMALPLLMMNPVTEERAGALLDDLLPDMLEALAEEDAAPVALLSGFSEAVH